MRIGRAAALFAAASAVGCSNRLLVGDGASAADGEASSTLSGAAQESGDDSEDGIVSVDGGGEIGDDGGEVGDEDGGESGVVVDCVDPQAPDVIVEVWPGEDPLLAEHDFVRRDLDCTIEEAAFGPTSVMLALGCVDALGPLADSVRLRVESLAIPLPVDLAPGVEVQARVYTWRDRERIDQLPWRRADHFALYRDGALAFAAGAGASFPSNAAGAADPEFFAPVVVNALWSECQGPAIECHDTQRGAWEIVIGDASTISPPFAVVEVGGYDLHLGELSTTDSPDCGEPAFGRVSLAIAPH